MMIVWAGDAIGVRMEQQPAIITPMTNALGSIPIVAEAEDTNGTKIKIVARLDINWVRINGAMKNTAIMI